MPNKNEIMNVFDAAALLGVHVQTLRKLARKKEIPSFKVGRDWKFRKEALVRWADEQHSPGTEGRDCSVLVIDDEEKVCRVLVRMLARFGCSTRQATGGAEGLAMVEHEAPDLILLDLVMPDMNGPQFLAKLRETHPQLPVVIVTGYPDSDLITQAMQYAPVMLLAKPIDQVLLERTIRSQVGGKLAATGGQS
jgi:excisionase family DNA binding protein